MIAVVIDLPGPNLRAPLRWNQARAGLSTVARRYLSIRGVHHDRAVRFRELHPAVPPDRERRAGSAPAGPYGFRAQLRKRTRGALPGGSLRSAGGQDREAFCIRLRLPVAGRRVPVVPDGAHGAATRGMRTVLLGGCRCRRHDVGHGAGGYPGRGIPRSAGGPHGFLPGTGRGGAGPAARPAAQTPRGCGLQRCAWCRRSWFSSA
jgi:hypothetical protein